MRAGNDLGSGRIGVLVGRIALPSMLAQFISVLYSIVDRIFIGQIPGEGALALAGAGVCGPVVTMVGSVAFLVGVGGAPLLSIKRGEGDDDAARGILANCFLMLCVFSVALPAAILPFREPMLRLFGASDATYSYAEAYFTLYLLGTPFALLASGLNQFIVCQGFATDGMKSVALCSSSLSASACAARPSPRCFPSSQAAFMRCAFCWAKSPPSASHGADIPRPS